MAEKTVWRPVLIGTTPGGFHVWMSPSAIRLGKALGRKVGGIGSMKVAITSKQVRGLVSECRKQNAGIMSCPEKSVEAGI